MIVVKLFITISAVLWIAEAQYQQYLTYPQQIRTLSFSKYPLKQKLFPYNNEDRPRSYNRDEKYEYDSGEKRFKIDDIDIRRGVTKEIDSMRKYLDSVVGRKLKNRFRSFDRDFDDKGRRYREDSEERNDDYRRNDRLRGGENTRYKSKGYKEPKYEPKPAPYRNSKPYYEPESYKEPEYYSKPAPATYHEPGIQTIDKVASIGVKAPKKIPTVVQTVENKKLPQILIPIQDLNNRGKPIQNVVQDTAKRVQAAPQGTTQDIAASPPLLQTSVQDTAETTTTTQVPSITLGLTVAETTQAPTTQAPTTQAPTTQAPTTQAPTTQAPTTQAPTTQAPTTQAPTTQAPTTQAPTTQAPTTQAPTTQAPTTQAPTTQAPTTQAPTTQAPTTQAPTTQAPTTQAPTQAPTTTAALVLSQSQTQTITSTTTSTTTTPRRPGGAGNGGPGGAGISGPGGAGISGPGGAGISGPGGAGRGLQGK